MGIATPPVGDKGVFGLLAPFDRAADSGVEYTCIAVRKLSDYLASNENPLELVYKPNGIEAVYDDDMANNRFIVTLQSRRGHILYVPENYILTYPSGSGHRYRAVSIVTALPSLPVSQDLTSLLADISALVKARLGVNTVTKVVETSQATLVSDSKHTEISTQRALAQTAPSDFIEKTRMEQELATLRLRLKELEQYVVDHQ